MATRYLIGRDETEAVQNCVFFGLVFKRYVDAESEIFDNHSPQLRIWSYASNNNNVPTVNDLYLVK
jgi:hypothetical protein